MEPASRWPRRIAVATAVAAVAVAAIYLRPDDKGKSVALGEPLKLRLDTRLGSYKP